MRQTLQLATSLARRTAMGLLAAWGLLQASAPSTFGQDASATAPAAEQPSEDPNRKAANISWNPKLSYDEWKAADKVRFTEFEQRLKTATLTDADKKALLKHIQNDIFGLTVEQNVDLHARQVERLARAAELPGTSAAARDFIIENSLKIAQSLIDSQPPNVQYSLVLLAARLNAKPADLVKRIPAQPYPGSRKFLERIVADEKYAVPVRIIAVRGLERLMRDGDISTVDKAEIGYALAKGLEQKVENPLARKWYRWKLVDALGVTGRYEDTSYRPVMIEALSKVLINKADDWEVRAAAARALSQLPLDQKTNIELVNYEIVRLLHDLAIAYNNSDRTPPSTWRWAFDSIYLAYRAATLAEQTQKHWGLMSLTSPRGREQIQSAYKVVLPVVKPILETQALMPVDQSKIKALADWLANNKPADRKLTAQGPELRDPSAAAGAATPQANVNLSAKQGPMTP